MSHRTTWKKIGALLLAGGLGCGGAGEGASEPGVERIAGALSPSTTGGAAQSATPVDESSVPAATCIGGSPTNLVVASDFDYADHGGRVLTQPAVTLWLCRDHFPIGSAARTEVELAADLYNKVAGTSVSVSVGSMPHKGIDRLFSSSPTESYMDVVDNSTTGFPCHDAGEVSGWAMNTCPHGAGADWQKGTSSVDQFVISVNANAYTFDTDPASTDYPRMANIAHELGHAFGMNHTPDWPDVDARALLSTMQGNLPLLPPHDRGYLRHFYPGNAGSTLNLTASPQVRVPEPSKVSGWSNRDFAEVNPRELYVVNGAYKDCATWADPVFQAQWLNQGQVDTSCTVKNRFRLGPAGKEDAANKITLKEWNAAKMPAASQDRIAVTIPLAESALSALSKDLPYDLTFKVDSDGDYGETDASDNVVTTPITLRSSYLDCWGGIAQLHPF
jgi:hypothetical protein